MDGEGGTRIKTKGDLKAMNLGKKLKRIRVNLFFFLLHRISVNVFFSITNKCESDHKERTTNIYYLLTLHPLSTEKAQPLVPDRTVCTLYIS